MKKLVRDKIPHILNEETKRLNPTFRAASVREAQILLAEKLVEESQELLRAVSNGVGPSVLEEIVDIYEVWMTAAAFYGYHDVEIRGAAMRKRLDRGGFDEFIIMEYPE